MAEETKTVTVQILKSFTDSVGEYMRVGKFYKFTQSEAKNLIKKGFGKKVEDKVVEKPKAKKGEKNSEK